MSEPRELSISGGHEPAEHALVLELAGLLVGRKVVEVRDELPESDPGWSDHGSIVLIFDDGAELSCGGWGHDAWGPSIGYTAGATPRTARRCGLNWGLASPETFETLDATEKEEDAIP